MAKVRAVTQRVGTMFTTFFTDQPVTNWATAKVADTKMYGVFFRAMIENGVYPAPSQDDQLAVRADDRIAKIAMIEQHVRRGAETVVADAIFGAKGGRP